MENLSRLDFLRQIGENFVQNTKNFFKSRPQRLLTTEQKLKNMSRDIKFILGAVALYAVFGGYSLLNSHGPDIMGCLFAGAALAGIPVLVRKYLDRKALKESAKIEKETPEMEYGLKDLEYEINIFLKDLRTAVHFLSDGLRGRLQKVEVVQLKTLQQDTN